MKIQTLCAFGFAAFCALVVGCVQSVDGRYPVSGTVKFDGKPMDYGQISFQPVEQNGTSSAAAQIANGKFDIPAKKGLTPGEYTVIFQRQEPTGKMLIGTKDNGETFEYEENASFIPEDWGFLSTQKVKIEAKKNRLKSDVPRSPEPVAPPPITGAGHGGV